MAKVAVIGAGLAGLTAALYATQAGHHVVIFDRRDRIGGKATSEHLNGVPIGFGPHCLDAHGPLMSLVKKISKIKPSLATIRLDKIHSPQFGILRPQGNVRVAAHHLRLLKNKDMGASQVQCVSLSSGLGVFHALRYEALRKQRLAVVGEGWGGLVGRLASALDEVGVLIEGQCEVSSIESGRLNFADGRTLEVDAVILATGWKQAKRLLTQIPQVEIPSLERVVASTLDVHLSSRPMRDKHAIIDEAGQQFILVYSEIHRRMLSEGTLFSAVALNRKGETSDQRMERLQSFLDHHAHGWKEHIVHDRLQASIHVQTKGKKFAFDELKSHNILLAGEWVESNYALSDAAVETGQQAGRFISTM